LADSDYIIEILLRAKDQASAKVAALKAELDRLTGTSSAEGVAKDIEKLGDKSEDAEEKARRLREEQVRGSQSARNLGRDIDDATGSLDRHKKSVDDTASSHENLGRKTTDVQDAMAETAAEFEKTGGASDDLNKKVDEIVDRFDNLGQEIKSGNKDLGDARREYTALGGSLDSLSKRFDIASQEATKLRDLAEQARASAKALQTLEPSSRQPISLSTDAQKQINSIKDLDQALQNYRSTLDQTGKSQQEQKNYIDAFSREYKSLANSLGPVHEEYGRLIADSERLRSESFNIGKSFDDAELKQKINDITSAYDRWLSKLKSGQLTENEAKRGAQDFARAFSSLSRQFELGGEDALKWGSKAEEASKIARKALLESTGGIVASFKRGDFGETFEAIGAHLDFLKFRLTGVASAVQGVKEVFIAAVPQQLVTGVDSLVGSLISVASAASEAGAALGGAFISGVGQLIPMISIAGAALLRFKSIFQAVSVKSEAEKTAYFEPNAGKIKELQNQSTLISANQQLVNSNIQLNDAQLQVRDSQIALTEAREQALKNITDLVFAEKSARLAAEGASVSLAEARRQEQISIEKGETTGIITAEEQVKAAELAKKKADWEVPWAEREANIARRRGVEGARSVVSARQSLVSSHQAVTQAEQAHSAAARERQITLLQAAQPSSSETSQEAQYQQLLSQMSGPEKALVKVLSNLEKQLKSPDSPLKKITDYFIEPFEEAALKLESLLGSGSFLEPIDNLAQAMGSSLKKYKNEIFGEKGTSFFEEMSKDATDNLPIVTSAILHLMNLFQDIAKAADPAFKKMSEDWDNFWAKLDTKYSTPEGVNDLKEFFTGAVKYAEGFAHLGSSIGSLFLAIGHDAAPQGLKTVTTFSESVERATKWVESNGPKVTKFFREAREGLSLIGGVLLTLGKEFIEVFNLSNLGAFSTFLKVVLIPGLGNVVKIVGTLTNILLKFFNLFGAPGRILLEGFGTILAGIFVITKVMKYKSAVMGTIGVVKGLYSALKIMFEGGTGREAWEALTSAVTKNKQAIEETKVAQEALNDERVVGGAESAGGAGAVSTAEHDAGSSTESDLIAGGEGAVGAIGISAADLVGAVLVPVVVAGGVAYILDKSTANLGQTYSSQGIPTTGNFGDELGRDIHHAFSLSSLGDAVTGNYAGFAQNVFGEENSSESSLRKFGNLLQENKGKIQNLSNGALEEISLEATKLAHNPALHQWKKKLEELAKAYSPATRAAQLFSENTKKYFESLGPVTAKVSKSFESIKESTEFIFKQVKERVKTNIESIAEDLGLHSKQGKEALISNFGSAETAIDEAMRKGTVSTAKGMKEIKELVSEALSKYGISNTEIQGSRNQQYRHENFSEPNNASGGGVPEYMRASGGWMNASPGGHSYRVGEAGHDEIALTTDPRHASRQASLLDEYLSRAPAVRSMAEGGTVSALRAFHASFGGTHMARVLAAADLVSNMNLPYVYGGGHTEPARLGDGVDCSGGVSFVTQQGGYKVPTTVSGDIGSWGFPSGEGLVTIFFNGDHTFMRIGDRYWGTSGFARQKDNGGAGWFESSPSASYLAGFNAVHLPDVEGTKAWISAAKTLENHGQQLTDIGKGKGAASFISAVQASAGKGGGALGLLQQIVAPKVKGGALIGKVVQGALNTATGAANQFLEKLGESSGAGIETSSSAGGSYNRSRLENLWDKEGGPRGMARIMAAISLAESAGNPLAESPVSDEGSHAEGLYQIEMPMNAADVPGGNAKNPIANTIGAIKILASQGLGAWETFVSGDYLKFMASGGAVKRLKEFASGGRAPWGGSPVPIIAHEGERIMNPSQYSEAARLAGTSPSGLDSHMGFNSSSPRQHFADGGIPRVIGSSAQASSSSNAISSSIARFMPTLLEMNPNEQAEFSNIQKFFKSLSKAFKGIKKFSSESGKYDKYIEEFSNEIGAANGLLEKMKTGREKRTELSTSSNIQKVFSSKGKIVKRVIGEPGTEGLDIRTMEKESQDMKKELGKINQLKNETMSQVSHVETEKSSPKRTAALNNLRARYNKLIEEQDNLSKAMSENIENRYSDQTQQIQDQVSKLESSYNVISQEQTSQESTAQSKGQYGQVQVLNKQIAASANKQIQNLQKPLKEAEKIGNTEEVNTIKQSIASLNQTIATAAMERINALQSEVNQAYQETESGITSEQGIAQALGNFVKVKEMDQQIISTTTGYIVQLENVLHEAEREGESSRVASIKEEISGLKQIVTNAVVEQITSAKSQMEQESSSKQSEVSLLQSKSKIAAERGNNKEAGEYEQSALIMKQGDLESERIKLLELKQQAHSSGAISEEAHFIEEINKNTEQLEENRLALQNNTAATVELLVKGIEASGSFNKSIYSNLAQGIETVGKITGVTNVKALKSATEGEAGALGTERSQLEATASGVGLGKVAGMSSQEILTWFASSEGQQTIKGLESSAHTEKEKETMRSLVSQLETNSLATEQNTEKMAELNGHLNQPQSFSTTAWEQYRGAFFNGMGGMLPAYAASLPASMRPENMPVYGSAAPGASSSTMIENLNLTHPVEVADPQLFSEELSHQIGQSPTAP
jgi:hypothetical protein